MEFLYGVAFTLILLISITVVFAWFDNRKGKKNLKTALDKSDFINEIKRFEPKEGDTIILRTPYKLSSEIAKDMSASIVKAFGLDPVMRLVILEDGQDVEIMSKNTT